MRGIARPVPPVGDLQARLMDVRRRSAAAADRCGRPDGAITIMGVTKTVPPRIVEAAIEAGLRMLGENRVQEARSKIPLVDTKGENVEWHFIGHLQTNKVKAALAAFDMIQSVDSLKLAEVIDRIATEAERRVPVLIEVNTSRERAKAGFALDEVDEAVATVVRLPALDMRGLMTVGPIGGGIPALRAAFRSLRRLRDDLEAQYGSTVTGTLSMGMSQDYEIAIEEGATMIRLGRALFGPRD